jgi:hypothetical protein
MVRRLGGRNRAAVLVRCCHHLLGSVWPERLWSKAAGFLPGAPLGCLGMCGGDQIWAPALWTGDPVNGPGEPT